MALAHIFVSLKNILLTKIPHCLSVLTLSTSKKQIWTQVWYLSTIKATHKKFELTIPNRYLLMIFFSQRKCTSSLEVLHYLKGISAQGGWVNGLSKSVDKNTSNINGPTHSTIIHLQISLASQYMKTNIRIVGISKISVLYIFYMPTFHHPTPAAPHE